MMHVVSNSTQAERFECLVVLPGGTCRLQITQDYCTRLKNDVRPKYAKKTDNTRLFPHKLPNSLIPSRNERLLHILTAYFQIDNSILESVTTSPGGF